MDLQTFVKPLMLLSFGFSLLMYCVKDSDNYTFSYFAKISFILSSIYYGVRDVSVGSDTVAYVSFFEHLSFLSLESAMGKYNFEHGFTLLTYLISMFTSSYNVYLFILSLLMSFFFWIFSYLSLDKSSRNVFLLILIAYPHFINANVNVIRTGLSISVLLCFIELIRRNNLKLSVLTFLFSFSMHSTALIGLLSLSTIIKRFKVKHAFIVWSSCLVVGLLNVTSNLELDSSIRFIDKINTYSNLIEEDYKTGFRIDFFIFSSIPIAIYILMILSKCTICQVFEFYFKIYFMLNSVYLVFMNVPFSDRFALTSWMLIPVFIALFSTYFEKYKVSISIVLMLSFLIFV